MVEEAKVAAVLHQVGVSWQESVLESTRFTPPQLDRAEVWLPLP